MDPKKLEEIVRVLAEHDVTKFELDSEDGKIKLARGPQGVYAAQPVVHEVAAAAPAAPVQLAPSAAAPAAAEQAPSSDIDPSWVPVESPIVGTFYRRPSPDAEPFASPGERVKKGDTLCIIEAMKLMNEIESPCDGELKKILLDDAAVVEFGETLFLIDPS